MDDVVGRSGERSVRRDIRVVIEVGIELGGGTVGIELGLIGEDIISGIGAEDIGRRRGEVPLVVPDRRVVGRSGLSGGHGGGRGIELAAVVDPCAIGVSGRAVPVGIFGGEGGALVPLGGVLGRGGGHLILHEIVVPVIGRGVLNRIDPGGIGGEVCPVDDAAAPDLAGPGLAIDAGEVALIEIFPVLVHGGGLHGIAHRSGGGHLAVVRHAAEQVHADPGLHGFRAGLFVFTIGAAGAARIGVAFPDIEHAEEGFACIGAVVVAVALDDLLDHRSVVGHELRIIHPGQRGRRGEVAVVEVEIVEGLRTVADIVADEGVPVGIGGEELFGFAGRIGEPISEGVLQRGLQPGEVGGVAHLRGLGHVLGAESQALACSVGLPGHGARVEAGEIVLHP